MTVEEPVQQKCYVVEPAGEQNENN